MLHRKRVKRVLGRLPLAAELDWALRGAQGSVGGLKLERLQRQVPDWVRQVRQSPLRLRGGKRVFMFAMLNYWLEQGLHTALAAAGQGHQVSFAYLPYSHWQQPMDKFDQRRGDLYVREALAPAEDVLELVSLLNGEQAALPSELADAVDQVAVMDTQYTLQIEEIDPEGELFQLRRARNRASAAAALHWLQARRPDVVLLPNGLILEFGAVYQVARYLDIPVVSYEFGEQRERIWLALNSPVMLQDTAAMWAARHDRPFGAEQRAQVRALFATRQRAGLFQNFYRQWQNVPSRGVEAAREQLGLDGRPVVLLAANVIGDSLTLGRAAFSGDMSSWLRRTLAYFANKDAVQFVLRVHPGEQGLEGPSVAELVAGSLPELPEHMRIVAAADAINTYDLVACADVGLVYTTTVGLEMAMSGLPVLVAGQTHYRGKGFTLDPESWDEYFDLLGQRLSLAGDRLNPSQVDQAWHYAYRFFFDYPQPYPWHLMHFQEDLGAYSLADLFSEAGQAQYGPTFDYMVGQPIDWEAA